MRALMPPFDCIQEFEQARTDRLWDGTALWSLHHDPGAVYLLGYATEITLKCAYFRCAGFSIIQAIGRPELNTALARARTLCIATPHEGFHSVRFWTELLIEHRVGTNRPLASAVVTTLRASANIAYDCWWIEMRYKRAYSSRATLERLASAVDWIDRNYDTLYK